MSCERILCFVTALSDRCGMFSSSLSNTVADHAAGEAGSDQREATLKEGSAALQGLVADPERGQQPVDVVADMDAQAGQVIANIDRRRRFRTVLV